MKKINRLLGLSVALIMTLCSCSSEKEIILTASGEGSIVDDVGVKDSSDASNVTQAVPKQESSSNSSPQKSSSLINVGFVQVGSESDWRVAQTDSMKSTFTEENGYALNFVDCNQDTTKQIDTIKSFVEAGMDYIILDPIIEEGYDDVLTSAKNANIPVIVVDRNISCSEELYSCWVGSDFYKEGVLAAEWLQEDLQKAGRDSEEINIVTVQGSMNSSAQIGRSNGFNDQLAEHSNWKLVDEQSGDFSEEGGYAVMKSFLQNHSDIDVAVAHNDNEAFGMITAIQEAGLTCGPGGDIILISFDATKGGFDKMIEGLINVDIECNPLEGPLVDELMKKLEKGETVEKIQYVEEGVYPAETAAEIYDSRKY